MLKQHFGHTAPTPKPDDKNGPYAPFIQLFEAGDGTFAIIVRDGKGGDSKIEMSKSEILGLAAAICIASR